MTSEANQFSPQLLHGPLAEIFFSLLWRIYRPYFSELEIGTRLRAANLAPCGQPDGYKFNNRAPVFIYWIPRLYLNKHTYPPSGVVHVVNIETLQEENYWTDDKQLTQVRYAKSYHF